MVSFSHPREPPKSSICSPRHFYKLPLVPKSPHTPLLDPQSLETGPLAADIQGALALWTCQSVVPLNPCHSPGTGMLTSISQNSTLRLRRHNLPKLPWLKDLAEAKFTQRSATSRDPTHTHPRLGPALSTSVCTLSPQISLYCYPTNLSTFIPRVSNHPSFTKHSQFSPCFPSSLNHLSPSFFSQPLKDSNLVHV